MFLGVATERQLKGLVETLWGEICAECKAGRPCRASSCPWRHSSRLARYFEYYQDITSSYVPEFLSGKQAALRAHEDLFDIIRAIKSHPDTLRSQITEDYFTNRDDGESEIPPVDDQVRAFNLAIRTMVMVNCSLQHYNSDLLELGSHPTPWRLSRSFSSFIDSAFPKSRHPLFEEDDIALGGDVRAAIKATRLKTAARFRLQPTDDLRSHLKLNRKYGILELYHHTSVLKQHLASSKSAAPATLTGQSIITGNLPRQLVLETLDSLQKILFPPDPESQALLRALISKASFDPDCLRFESAQIRSESENEIQYQYFATRLADLYDEVRNPTPRGLLEKWLERRSGARNIMLVTLIAIGLGIAALAISIFQAWVGYQQWKHPTRLGSK